MALKSYKPTTPGQRGLVLIDRSELWKGRPVKALTEGVRKNGGRNNTGRITMRRKGGGARRLYRIVDFKRNKLDIPATVERIEYDPNRTAFIALIKYEDGQLAYILAPQRLAVGDTVISSAKADVKPGNAMPFTGLPIGSIIHNIELKQGKGGQIARAAGTYAQFVGRDGGYAQIRLSSGELRLVRQECMATVGAVSNPDNSNQNFGKAGRNRHKGIRPSVRGVVMNPVDHPHGGGEGRTSGGRHPVTPWGKPTKGARTRNKNKASSKLIIRSRHAKKKGREYMSRSVWKGPFVDAYVLKKAEAARESGRNNDVIKIWSRRSTILPQFVGLTFGVYNGHKHIPVSVSEEMIGQKFGEYSPTRTYYGHAADKKAKRK
jgi:large subunit ribosomal protein L2